MNATFIAIAPTPPEDALDRLAWDLRRWSNWLEWNKGWPMEVEHIEELSLFLRELADETAYANSRIGHK